MVCHGLFYFVVRMSCVGLHFLSLSFSRLFPFHLLNVLISVCLSVLFLLSPSPCQSHVSCVPRVPCVPCITHVPRVLHIPGVFMFLAFLTSLMLLVFPVSLMFLPMFPVLLWFVSCFLFIYLFFLIFNFHSLDFPLLSLLFWRPFVVNFLLTAFCICIWYI